MTSEADPIAPLREFVVSMTRLVDRTDDEPALLAGARPAVRCAGTCSTRRRAS